MDSKRGGVYTPQYLNVAAIAGADLGNSAASGLQCAATRRVAVVVDITSTARDARPKLVTAGWLFCNARVFSRICQHFQPPSAG